MSPLCSETNTAGSDKDMFRFVSRLVTKTGHMCNEMSCLCNEIFAIESNANNQESEFVVGRCA